MANFNVGDTIYFSKYTRDVQDKMLRPGQQADIVEVTELNGETAYVVENKKGQQETVLAKEIKLKQRMSKDMVGEALSASPAANGEAMVDILDEREEDKKRKLLDGNGGQGHTLLLIPELDQRLDQRKEDPLAVALHYSAEAERAYFRLGGSLAYIYVNDLHKDYGYVGRDAFNRFVDEQIPNMQSRTARYFMEIYVRFTNLGIPEDEVVKLGWTLAAQIARVATEDNVRELMEYAQKNGLKALKAHIKTVYEKREDVRDEIVELRPGEHSKLKHVTISVFEDQFSMLENALNHVWEQYPEYDKSFSQGLMLIVSEFMNSVYASQQGGMTKEQFLQFGETAFPELEVFLRNRKNGEVLSSEYEQGQVAIQVPSKKKAQVEAAIG